MHQVTFISVAVLSIAIATAAQEICFGEVNGNIPFEAESVTLPPTFIRDTSIAGFSGTSHITYIAENRYRAPLTSEILEYKVFSPFGGDYTFFLRGSRDRNGTLLREDEANDIWLNAPTTQLGRIWVKMFSSFGEEDLSWIWSPRLENGKDFLRASLYLTPGVTSIIFSGRSTRYSPDKGLVVKKRQQLLISSPEYRVNCSTGLELGAVPPVTVPCLSVASQVAVQLYRQEFAGRKCKFIALEALAVRLCSNGICGGIPTPRCYSKLTARLRRKMSSPLVCPA